MPRFRPLTAPTIVLVLALAAPAPGAEQTLAGHKFTLPDGFIVEPAAAPPLVERPIHASFDEAGRLYVVESSGSNDKPEKQLADKPHRALRLEDTDGDGCFDRSTVFADKLMFPQGCLWFRGSLYVGAPPSIWKLTDTNDDGVADERSEWWQGKTLTGCANDLHGPYAGPDGWLYWTKGAFAKQTHDRPGRKPLVTRAAHVYRARPDGTDFEAVMTGGMDNPVEVAFNAAGEMFLTTTFFQHPEVGRRDGLIHVIYGGVYGKEHDPIDEHPRTGDVLPVLSHLGAAAPAGLECYRSGAFGMEFEDNLFAALFNLRKVTRHVLQPSGSTYTSADSDFLVSDNNDFHPTDVLEAPDGSLLVVDTGGWYKLCCPTSQLAKPDVLGALYRVRRQARAAPRAGPARQPAVEPTAAEAAAILRGAPATADVALARAIRAAGRERERAALADLRRLTRGPAPLIRRLAAQAIGRIGDPGAVPALLDLPSSIQSPPDWDRALEHAVIHALIEIGDAGATRQGLSSPDARVERVALIALDQMQGGGLEAGEVAARLDARDAPVRDAALWIATRHRDWGGALESYFRRRLAAAGAPGEDAGRLADHLSRFGRDRQVQSLLIAAATDVKAPAASRIIALRAIAAAGIREMPAGWPAELARLVGEADAAIAAEALAAVRSLPAPKNGSPELQSALSALGGDPARPEDLRLGALAAAPGGLTGVAPPVLEFLRAEVASDRPAARRSAAADVIARAKLSEPQLEELLETLRRAGPLEITRVLSAFTTGKGEALGTRLVGALKEAESLTSLHSDWIKPVLASYPDAVRGQAEEVYALLNADRAQQQSRLEELLAQMKGGDIRRGQAVFNSEKTACRTCHAMGYQGGRVGPDLTRIGEVRTERDLLESLIYPSASFVRSYEPFVVVTRAGEVHSGVFRREAPDEVILTTGALTEVRIDRGDIAEIRPGAVSVMPQGLEGQLTTAEIADLLAFLRSTRWGPQ